MLSPAVSLMESGEHNSTSRKLYMVTAEKETHKKDEILGALIQFQGVFLGGVQDSNPKMCSNG